MISLFVAVPLLILIILGVDIFIAGCWKAIPIRSLSLRNLRMKSLDSET